MPERPELVPDSREPLGALALPAPGAADLGEIPTYRVEFSSRGDRVAGRLLLPPQGTGRAPLLVLGHGAGGHAGVEYLAAAAGPWARGGAAVLSLDLPLHGERRNPKLSERLASALASGAEAPADRLLAAEVHRQAVADLRRALDAVECLTPRLGEQGGAVPDGSRVAFVGFSLGAMVGAAFVAEDPRPRAAVLALAGSLGPPEVDPARYVGRIAPRPVLFVNARDDATIPATRAEALHRAAADPFRVSWWEGGHRELPGRALKEMWRFLAPILGLDPEAARRERS